MQKISFLEDLKMASTQKNTRRKFSIRLLGFMMVLALLAVCVSPAPSYAANPTVSGKIVIYTSMYEDIIEMLNPVMKKMFPNLDVTFFYGGTGALQAKIAAEIATGVLGCDMFMVADPSYAMELKEMNLLHPYMSPHAPDLGFDYDPNGYWYPVRVSNMVLGYNPGRYAKNTVPNSMYDFAFDSSVKGAISKSNPLTSGTALAAIVALYDKYGIEYYKALGSQGVMIESGSVALTKLETGECKVIMVLEESILKKREEDGSKLEVIYPTDGTIVVPSPIMAVNNKWSANKNTVAAEAVIDFFLSTEGQSYIVAGWMHSVRKDAAKAPYDAIPTADIRANHMPVDWVRAYQQREDFRTKFVENVQR
jgi:iron(III) transport system substrate-binding protein